MSWIAAFRNLRIIMKQLLTIEDINTYFQGNIFFYTYNSFRAVRFEKIPTGKIDKLLEDTFLKRNVNYA